MTPDLFAAPDMASPTEYREALDRWLENAENSGRLQRESSSEVYEHMWQALTAWAISEGLPLHAISAGDLERYLASRGGSDDLSARYAFRVLHLADAILRSYTNALNLPLNTAASELLQARPDIRFANGPGTDPLPSFLRATEAKLLITFLCAVRPGKSTTPRSWQEIRNRSSVAVMLGAGVTPGEVRALETNDVVIEGGASKAVPWKLRVPGNGNSPSRETPMAPWAGQLVRYWLEVRSEQSIPGAMLFPSTKSTGKPWGKVAQYEAAKDVLRSAGVDDVEGGSFRLRHTFALRQLRRGKAPHEVARWLGVTNPAVMERYSRVLPSPADVV